MKETVRDVAVVASWGVSIAAVVLQALYRGSWLLTAFDLALLSFLSVYAGLLLIDPRKIVLGYLGALGSSLLVLFLCLSLPAFQLRFLFLRELVYEQAIVMIIRSIFPAPIILIFVSGVIGGFLGERLDRLLLSRGGQHG